MKKYFLICFGICIILLLFMVKIAFSADIDVGSAAIDRASSADTANYTTVAAENPANASGTINHIEIYMNSAGAGATIDVASFYVVSGNNLSTRGSSGNLTVVVGLNTFNAPGDFTAFDINVGDYIGFYSSSTGLPRIEQDITGSGKWYKPGDYIPCTDTVFTWLADRTISLYAEGSTGAPPAVGVQPQVLMLE
jgi:hypothetical protein